jgi:CRP/FNR family transcriptional regulator, polysaccharide utilization system transcription regulator
MVMLNIESGIKDIIYNTKSVFYLLTDEERKELEQHIFLYHYKKNEVIFNQGDKPATFIMLVNGKVKIFREGIGSHEQIIQMAGSMEILGFSSLFAEKNHISTAVTLEDSLVCSVNYNFIINVAFRNYSFSKQIIKKLSEELSFLHCRTVSLTQKHIRGRLAESLILLIEKFGYQNDRVTLSVYLSREDIANLSNMTPSNAIRTLSAFANEKVIAIDRRKIGVLDFGRLERISKLG